MSSFRLPDLGEGLSEAEIRQWHVAAGDKISVDDPLVSVETAKAIVEVPSPQSGTIRKCHGAAGDVVATGAVLVEFEGDDEPTKNADSGTVVGEVKSGNTVIQESGMGITQESHSLTNHPKASPAIRMLAHQSGLCLNKILGSGPNGAITRHDIETAAKQPNRATEEVANTHTESLSAVDRYMAELMEKSHREVVAVTVIDDADISLWPAKLDITVTLIRALIHACQEVPHLNAHFNGELLTRTLYDDVHVGFALDTEHGLFVPVIKNAQTLNDEELREQINDFKTKAQARELTQHDMQGASVTLSNFGSIGGKYANPIVVPPTVAIVGVGHRFERAVTKTDHVTTHNLLPISLTFDHRAVTGGQASRFIAAMITYLQKPAC